MSLRSLAKIAAPNPRSSDFFCVIEPCEEEVAEAGVRTNAAAPNAAVVSLLWGSTVVAMKTFTRTRRVSLADLGVMEESIGPSFEIKADHRGVVIHTPHGDALPHGFRMRMLCEGGHSTAGASRRAVSLTLVAEAVTLSGDRLSALLPDARGRALGVLAVAFFPLMLGIFRVGAPDPRAPEDVEARRDQLAFVQMALAAADKREEKAQAVDDDHTDSNGTSAARGGTGGSSAGEEGSKGDSSTRKEEGLARAEQRKSAPPSAKEIMAEANTFGMISLLDKDDKNARPASAFANFDIDAANGGLRGNIFADAFGMGSEGLSGVGEGGGGKGAGVGITQIGTLGHGVSSADKDGSEGGYGFGRAGGHLRERGAHVTYGFSDRGGTTMVNGRLPPESIQRVVRANFGRLRGCYEEALLRNPTLEGRVNVKFVIDRTGAVSAAQLAPDTTLDDEKVTSCVVAHYKRMSFPEPEGGIVTVVYPVMFSSG